jgi:hypothetical protein
MTRWIVVGFLGSLIVAGCAVSVFATDVVWSVGGLAVAVASSLLLAWAVED